MTEPLQYVDRCSVAGCPHPNSEEWHRCFICHRTPIHHHHFPSRAQAGKGAKIVAALCPRHHQLISENKLMEGVYKHPDGSRRYYVKDLKGVDLCDVVIEPAKEEGLPTTAEISGSDPDLTGDLTTAEYLRDIRESPEPPPSPRETALSPYQERHLQLDEPLTWDSYRSIAKDIQAMHEAINFWIGDAVLAGEEAFGEKCYQAWGEWIEIIEDKETGEPIEILHPGIHPERLKQCAWVSSRIPVTLRNAKLSWTHYRLVSHCEEPERAEWLRRANDEELGTRELQALMAPKPADVCPDALDGKHEYACKWCGKERG